MHALDRIRALLAARTAGLSDLVTAVHRVNPTDRRLSPAAAEHYRLKAALQSRLLRDDPDPRGGGGGPRRRRAAAMPHRQANVDPTSR